MVNLAKILLVVGAGKYQTPGIIKAKRMGINVIATDYDPYAIGFKLSNYSHIVDVKDKEGNLELAKKYKIDGVVSFATELAVPTVAYIAEKLKLPGINLETALNATNKLRMRQLFKRFNVPSVPFFEIKSLKTLFNAANELGFPFIIKPVDSSGKKGVTVINTIDSIPDAFNWAISQSSSKTCIAEKFFEGIECTIEGFAYKGKHTVYAISQKKKPDTKYRVATELFYPPTFRDDIIKKIEKSVTDAVSALGIDNAMTHTEVIVNEKGELIIVEVAARGGGFGIADKIIEYITGFDPITALIQLSIGEEVKIDVKKHNSAVLKFFAPDPGIMDKIEGKEKLQNIENTEVEFFVNEGEVIPVLMTDGSRTGSIISWGSNRNQVQQQLQEAEQAIHFKISPFYPTKENLKLIDESKSMIISEKAKELRKRNIEVVDLSWGETFLEPSKKIIEASQKCLTSKENRNTSSKGNFLLREAISKDNKQRLNFKYDPDNEILITSGRKSGLFCTLYSLIHTKDEVIIFEPFSSIYEKQVKLTGGKPVFIPSSMDELFRPNIEKLSEKISKNTKLLILNSPCNPTGVIFTRKELEAISKLAIENNLVVISDEVYKDITYDKEFTSIAQIKGMRNRTIIIESFSKSYAMDGWMIGNLCAPNYLMESIYKVHQLSTVSVPNFVQEAAIIAINECKDEVVNNCRIYKERRDYLIKKSKDLENIELFKPEGGIYTLLKLPQLKLQDILCSAILLEEYKVAAVPGSTYGKSVSNWLRLCFARPENDLLQGIQRISQFLKEYKN